MLFLVIFTNNDEYFTINIDREFSSEVVETESVAMNPAYDGAIEEVMLSSTAKNYKIIFAKGFRVLFTVVFVAYAGFSVYFIHLLLQFVKSALSKAFFSFKNVLRIRWMAFILIGLGISSLIMRLITQYIAYNYFEKDLTSTGFTVSFNPDIFTNGIFIGLIVLIVAQAFDHGLKLKEEQDLTI